jgi:HEAT repeat protein
MKSYLTRLMALLLFAATATAVAAASPATVDLGSDSAQSRELYRAGHAALDRQDWLTAVQYFRTLESELHRSKGGGRDAALYWQAYALDHSGDRAGAIGLSQKLLSEFPDSVWADDAAELLGHQGDADSERIMALDALMVSVPEKALPILQRVLAGEHSDQIKKRALFILVQLAPAAAADAIESILAGNSSVTLKREAIQTLALAGDQTATARLVAYYSREQDAALKRAVIDAGLVGARPELVLALARHETDPELQSHAIRVLGAMGESARVAELLPELTDGDAQRSAIDALAIAGDVGTLSRLVASSVSMAVRTHAVRALSIIPAARSVPALIELYRQPQDPQVRRALLHALSASGDPAALEAIGKTLD